MSDVKLEFKLLMMCNIPPSRDQIQNDPAMWNRIKLIPFESTFITSPQNKNIKDKI